MYDIVLKTAPQYNLTMFVFQHLVIKMFQIPDIYLVLKKFGGFILDEIFWTEGKTILTS